MFDRTGTRQAARCKWSARLVCLSACRGAAMSPFERKCVVENGGSTPPKPAERRAIPTWYETPYVRCIRL